jgi:L-ascorbate metabolism protein UlaG (beta-lactamase superfamily)
MVVNKLLLLLEDGSSDEGSPSTVLSNFFIFQSGLRCMHVADAHHMCHYSIFMVRHLSVAILPIINYKPFNRS